MAPLTKALEADGKVVWSWRQGHFLNNFKDQFSLKSAGPD
jgi:hypothetical protein